MAMWHRKGYREVIGGSAINHCVIKLLPKITMGRLSAEQIKDLFTIDQQRSLFNLNLQLGKVFDDREDETDDFVLAVLVY